MKYFDTHCHLNGSFYKKDVEASLEEAKARAVSHIVMPGSGAKDSLRAIKMAQDNPNLYAAIGIHPSDVLDNDLAYLEQINPDDIVAVGEVGIDLYHPNHPPLATQIKFFKTHLDYATKHNKPVLIHMRNSAKETYEVLKDYPKLKFVMHSYTDSWTWAEKFLALGAYISFSGIVTFKNAKEVQEVAKKVPKDKILAETDAPFLAPTPYRGKHNEPAYVKEVVDFLCQLTNDANLKKQIFNNSLAFFNL